jgi:hypothetical protein
VSGDAEEQVSYEVCVSRVFGRTQLVIECTSAASRGFEAATVTYSVMALPAKKGSPSEPDMDVDPTESTDLDRDDFLAVLALLSAK